MPYKDKEKQREAQRKWEKENRGAGKRHKVWMFIFYPDTAEVGWRDECDELGLPFLVSPLHDRDVWTAADERRNPDHIEGEVKVAHYHGLVEYPQPVDYDTVKEDFAFLHTHSIKYAKSKASMALYLTHEKCSDKVQYDWRDVLEFGGANWHDWCNELEDLHAMMKEMRQYIIANNVSEFYEFQFWCDEKRHVEPCPRSSSARGQSAISSSGGATPSSRPRILTVKSVATTAARRLRESSRVNVAMRDHGGGEFRECGSRNPRSPAAELTRRPTE